MNNWFSKFILLLVVISLVVPQSLRAQGSDDSDDEDLSSAFAALNQSMGAGDKDIEISAVDQALEQAFSPIPAEVTHSRISLDDPRLEDVQALTRAVGTLAAETFDTPDAPLVATEKTPKSAPVTKSANARNDGLPKNTDRPAYSAPIRSYTPLEKAFQPSASMPIQTEYEQHGAALSLTLWSGSQKTLKDVLTNIVKQVYADKDPRTFRFVVSSSPMPSVDIRSVDLNEEKRAAAEAEAHRVNESLLVKLSKERVKPAYVPVRMGTEISITAGMLATVKTVDELAGQIAKKLAQANPTVYGWKEDTRFTSNQEYIELINQIIQNSNDETKADLTKKRDEVISELSAMERLGAGGFSPWALQRYERRRLSWMGDVFAKSSKHSLARMFFNLDQYHFDDPSRSLRILLQTGYMQFMQRHEQGKGLASQETEFSPKMKAIRLRMKLFTEPLFLGWPLQVAPALLAGGVAIAGIHDVHIAHWALNAFNQTGGHLSNLWHGSANEVGSLVHKVRTSATEELLKTGYFGAHEDATKQATHEVVAQFYNQYRLALYAGTGIIAAGTMRLFKEKIANFVSEASRVMRIRENNRKQNAVVPEEEIKPDVATDKIFEEEIKDGAQIEDGYAALPEAKRLEMYNTPTRARVSRQSVSEPWYKEFLRMHEGLLTYFKRLRNRDLVKSGQIYVHDADNTQEGFVVAIAPDHDENEVRPRALETNFKPGIQDEEAKEESLPWADRFDEWQNSLTKKVSTTKAHTVRVVVRLKETTASRLSAGAKHVSDGFGYIFIDVPVSQYKVTMKDLAELIRQIKEKHAEYQVWRQGAPERKRIRDEKAAEEQRKEEIRQQEKLAAKALADEQKRVQQEKLAREKIEAAKKAAELAAQKKITDAELAAKKKIDDAAAKVEKARLKAENKIKKAQQKITDAENARIAAVKQKKAKELAKIAAAEAARLAKESKIAAKNAENARLLRIANNADKRQEMIDSPETKPADIADAVAEMYKLGHEANWANEPRAEKWGYDNRVAGNFPAKSDKVFERFLAKWVVQAKKFGTNEAEVTEVLSYVSRAYDDRKGEKVTRTNFFQNAMSMYEILLEKISFEDRQHLTNRMGNDSKIGRYNVITQNFLFDAEIEREARLAVASKSRKDKITTLLNASDRTRNAKFKQIYAEDPSELIRWAVAPETKRDDIRAFFTKLTAYLKAQGFAASMMLRNQFSSAVSSLSPIEKVKMYLNASDFLTGDTSVGDKGDYKELQEASANLVKEWVEKAKNARELAAEIEADCAHYQISPDSMKVLLRDAVVAHPELLVDKADVSVFVEKEFFWPTENSLAKATVLEGPLKALFEEKKKAFKDSPAWKYDPISTERMHKFMRDRLHTLHQFPTSFEGLEQTWKDWTNRGVSTISDEILGDLLKKGSQAQIDQLEIYAVTEGRVFDQGVSDEFAIRQIKKSPEYAALMHPRVAHDEHGEHTLPPLASLPGAERTAEINALLVRAQGFMKDMGMRYTHFLEDLSGEIRSTYEEAKIIHSAKVKRLTGFVQEGVDAYSDSRVKMLKDILPYVKKWSPDQQFKFILYLRGSIESKDFKFIEKQFPTFGPERIRKIYQGLPIESAVTVTHLFLQETLLARDDADQGYGKKIIKYLVSSSADPTTRERSAEFLDALLYGIEKSGNKEFKMNVLSTLIAMKSGENDSIGETIKLILEQFPGVGPKIGQFLVATELMDDDINDVLRHTQDRTLPPKRFDMYNDLFGIVGEGRDMGIQVDELLGSGSLKYSVKAKELKTEKHLELALQVFRQDVQNNSDLQITILNYAIDRLVKNDRRNAFLRVIVDGAMSAVSREKEFEKEAGKTKFAKQKLYNAFSDDEFDVSVPVQALLNKRLLQSKFAHGGSFNKMADPDKVNVGLKILAMEAKILYAQPDENGDIWYDTDRHAGNYLVEKLEGQAKKYRIAPIDFGQLTSIKAEQRAKVPELFAFAAMLETFGANEWLAKEVATKFGISGVDYVEFAENLKAFFPGGAGIAGGQAKGSTVKSYFSLIAAMNEALRTNDQKVKDGKLKASDLPPRTGDLKAGKLDLVYTDFVRAVIQLNQYEESIQKISGIPHDAMTPRKILEAKAKDILADKLQKLELNGKQNLKISYLNARKRLDAKLKGEKFEPINIRMSREELEKYSIFTRKSPAGATQPQGLAQKPTMNANCDGFMAGLARKLNHFRKGG